MSSHGCAKTARQSSISRPPRRSGRAMTRYRRTKGSDEMVLEGFEKRAEIGRTLGGSAVHSAHFQRGVGVCHHVPETRGTSQPFGQRVVNQASALEPAERVRIALRCAQIEPQTCREGEVDGDLHGLPEVQHDGVRRIGRRKEIVDGFREPVGDALQMPFDGHDTLGQQLAIELAHCANR
jgi:hypothetical protein